MTTPSGKQIGVYCLANDVVIEWFEAFMRSYKAMNSNLPLTVIPYDGNIARLRSLQGKYNFAMMDEAHCAKFDELATRVNGRSNAAGMFRKLACFFGSYDEFIFLDSDVVITFALKRVFEVFLKSNYDFVYFDFAIAAAYTPDFAAKMIANYASHGFNAGGFVSRKGVLREEDLWPLADQAAKVRDGLVIGTIDQPYFNYIMDITRCRMTRIDNLLPELSCKAYARQPFVYDPITATAWLADGKLLPFIHWAGCGWPTMVRPEVFLHYRTLGLPPAERLAYRAKFYFIRWKRMAGNFLRRHGLKK